MSKRAGLLLCVMLALSCERQTGYCERPEDCTITVSKTMLGGSAADGAGGTISSDPSKLVCDVTCQGSQATFPMGVGVKLTVEPAPGWRFAGWSGPCEGVTPTCTVQVGTAKEVKARFVRKVCSQDNWCWENPLPTGNDLNGVWASSASDAWTVGAAGTILRWDGEAWRRTESTTSATLQSVWGSSKDAWAVGDGGTILRWNGTNGTAWSSSPQRTNNALYAVWGSGSTDVWAVGDGSTILHYDGTSWSDVNQMALANMGCDNRPRRMRSIWGSSSSDVWVVGACGTALHYTGNWARTDTATDTEIAGVGGSGPDDVWASGNKLLLHWQSGKWAQTVTNAPGIEKIWAANQVPSFTWAVMQSGGVLQRIGSEWYPIYYSVAGLRSIAGSGVSDIWAVGSRGTILHYDGGDYWSQNSTDEAPRALFRGVWGRSPTDIWAVGDKGLLLRWNGVAWKWVLGPGRFYKGVFGNSSGGVYFISDDTLYIWNEEKLEIQAAAVFDDIKVLLSGWSFGSNDVWVGRSSGRIDHWDGKFWTETSVPPENSDIRALWGASNGAVYAISLKSVLRWTGVKWEVIPGVPSVAPLNLHRIWGSSPNDLWVVAHNDSDSTMLHYDGKVWARLDPPKGTVLAANWVDGDGQAWGAASQGIFRWDGKTWKLVSSGAGLKAIWGSSPGDIWAVGDSGAILHYQK